MTHRRSSKRRVAQLPPAPTAQPPLLPPLPSLKATQFTPAKMAKHDDNEHLYPPDHYVDCTPEDAMLMSRTGTAHGYDNLMYGERWLREGKTPDRPVMQIDKRGVQRLMISAAQQAWIERGNVSDARMKARRKMVKKFNFTAWEDLSQENRDYLLSLHWMPAKALTAMEIIARMVDS